MFTSFHYFPSSPLLQSAIEHFQIVEIAQPATIRSIPNARIDAWVVLEGRIEICYDASGLFFPVPAAGIMPMRDKHLIFRIPERVRVINFKCYPHVLANPVFAPVLMSEVALGFSDFLPPGEVAEMMEKTRNAPQDALKIKYLELFLAKQLSLSPDAWLQNLVRSMSANGKRIEQLAADTFVSVKTMERRFQRWTGLNPKTFCKLARFQQAVKTIQKRGREDAFIPHLWDAGYYDQSHFVKDCRALTGLPPRRFFEQLPPSVSDLVLLDGLPDFQRNRSL